MPAERKYETVIRYAVTTLDKPIKPAVLADIRKAYPDYVDTPTRVVIRNDSSGAYSTPEEAQSLLVAMMKNNSPARLAEIFRLPLAVCPVECYLPSLQPVRAHVRADSAIVFAATEAPVAEIEDEEPELADAPQAA